MPVETEGCNIKRLDTNQIDHFDKCIEKYQKQACFWRISIELSNGKLITIAKIVLTLLKYCTFPIPIINEIKILYLPIFLPKQTQECTGVQISDVYEASIKMQ